MLNRSRCCPRGPKSFQRSPTEQTDLLPNSSESPQMVQVANGWPGVLQATPKGGAAVWECPMAHMCDAMLELSLPPTSLTICQKEKLLCCYATSMLM